MKYIVLQLHTIIYLSRIQDHRERARENKTNRSWWRFYCDGKCDSGFHLNETISLFHHKCHAN